jgi:hypothetical protein
MVLAVVALGIGLLTGSALAGKKKNTYVVFFQGFPTFNPSGQVKAKGALNTTPGCRISRGVKLQLLDPIGVVTAVLDGSSTDSNGNWILSGKLPATLPTGTNSVRVKANKASAGKIVCKVGISPSVPIPTPTK